MSITKRLDAALERLEHRQMKVRGIYLTPADHEALAKATTYHWRKHTGSTARAIPLSYHDHLIFRSERRSSIYSTHGVEVVVPKRLSAKV